jgi:MFS family permease
MTSDRKNVKNNIFLAICIIGFFAILSTTLSKNPVLKLFVSFLETPATWTGIVASASTIPGILVSLPAASLSDVFGRRKFLLISGIIFASAPFLYIFVNSWWQLIPVRFYHGFATAIFVPVAEASITELFPSKRGERLSLFSSATSVGRGLAPFLGGYILYVTDYSYQTLYLAVGIAGVTAFATTLLFLAEKRETAPAPELVYSEGGFRRMLQGWSDLFKHRSVMVVSLVQAAQYYAYGAVEYFLSGYLKDNVLLDPFLIGTVMGSQIVAVIVAKPFIGRASDKFGRRTPIIAGSLVCGIALLPISFISDFPAILLLSVLYGLGFAAVTASTSALVSELVRKELVGTSMGFLDTLMDVGQTIGLVISGLVFATSLQYTGVFASLTCILVFSCIIFLLSRTANSHTNENSQGKV